MNERRTLAVLIVVTLGQLLVVTSQLPSADGEQNLLESALLATVAPVATVLESADSAASGLGEGLRSRRALVDDNRQLRREIESLREKLVLRAEVESELERLATAVEYQSQVAPDELRVCDVVYIDHASWLQTLVIATGERDARRNQAVVSSEGLVGRVVVVSRGYAKVQLVTDRAASVGGMISRTRRQGVVRGAGKGRLELDFVPLQADVQVGDRVVSAGIDGVYPRGLPIGTVVDLERGDDLFHHIRVAPAVDFGRLDQVYLLEAEVAPEDFLEPVESEDLVP